MKTALTKKYGPLPLWAWTIITAVVLFVGYSYMKNRSASASGNAATNPNPLSRLMQPSGAGGAGSLTIPGMQAVQSTDTPFTSPSPDPQPQLVSAPITDLPPSDAVAASQRDASIMELINSVQAGDLPPSALDQYLDPNTATGRAAIYAQKDVAIAQGGTTAASLAWQLANAPPTEQAFSSPTSPAPITTKILPEALPTPIKGQTVAV